MSETILRLPTVKARTGLSRSTLYLYMARGEFPQAVPLGQHAVGWAESAVAKWIDERISRSKTARRACEAVTLESAG